jgi:isoleucyl-tRNA synthetase
VRFGSELPEDVEVALPIWTTTPWTLPASLAISLGPELEYVLVEGPNARMADVAGWCWPKRWPRRH